MSEGTNTECEIRNAERLPLILNSVFRIQHSVFIPPLKDHDDGFPGRNDR